MSNPPANGQSSYYDHELSISELFARTFECTRKNYLRVLPVFIVAGILSGLDFFLFTNSTALPDVPSKLSSLSSAQLIALLDHVLTAIGYTWLSYFIGWLILYFAVGVAIWQMSKGQETSLQQTQSPEGSATLNYRNLGLTTFVSVLLVSLGLFMVLVGAIIAGIILYLALAASVLENRGVGSAIGRSRQLVSGRWVKTFVLLAGWLVFANLISIFAGGFVALALPSTLFGTEIVNFVQNLILALLFPFVSASMLVLYRSSTSSMFHQQVARAPPSPYDSMKPEPMWNSTSSSTSRSPFPAPPPFPGAEQRFCSNCGVKLSTDEKFCHNCGSAVART